MARFLIFLFFLLFLSCAKKVDQTKVVEKPQPEPYLYHTVKYPGETLSIIADWYTGNAANWKILAKENPQIKPNTIKLGDTIKIPRSMLKNSQPLPKNKVTQSSLQKSPQKFSDIKPADSISDKQKEISKSEEKNQENLKETKGVIPTPTPVVDAKDQADEERERVRKELLRELLK